ncbi:MAG TPA: RAD55 family ATPase [Thermoplasmata archaeon]|nr:RAD55 family ATPase [Thermoplasmata archaeon]
MFRFHPNTSVLISGPPGVGKFEYLIGHAREWIAAGERLVFVTLDLSPREVRDRAAGLGLDIPSLEGGSLVFVDCYSASAGDTSEAATPRRVFSVSSFSNLEGIGMAIQKAAQELRPPVRVVFYTISTLFLHNSTQAIAKFFQIITSRVKTSMGFIAYAVHEGVHEPTTMNLLRSLTDGVVELRFNEAMGREHRVHHMRGTHVDPHWMPLELEAQTVLLGGA